LTEGDFFLCSGIKLQNIGLLKTNAKVHFFTVKNVDTMKMEIFRLMRLDENFQHL